MEIFKIQDLTYYYPNSEKPALDNINLTINEGEFILLFGESGSGKSTLGRVFNKIVPEFYGGKIKGKIHGNEEVGMVFQDPERQLLMDRVEREIAFGLENLGVEHEIMKKKVMECLSFLNMWDIKDKKTYELSGGQKQKTAIGATIAMGYKILVFDEPTSQLDPVTAEEILNIIKRLNDELGYTIILIEQRIDRCFHLADRILFMEDARLVFDGKPKDFVFWCNSKNISFLPPVADFFVKIGQEMIPFTVKEGRKQLKTMLKCKNFNKKEILHKDYQNKDEIINIKKLKFTYKGGKDALKGIDLRVEKGEILGIMGENGGGKSTLLKNISGILKPTKGEIVVKGVVGFLSQNPNDYLFNDTLYEELKYTLDNNDIKDYSRIDKVLKDLNIYEYRHKNPRDLSGGEKQRAALASILVMEPEILLLDEPTRGLDNIIKDRLGEILLNLKKLGKTIIIVTHDVEFLGKFTDRVCLIFDGQIAQIGSKCEVLNSGIYYSTQINKLFSGKLDGILTLKDALDLFEHSPKEGVI
ncbi:ABC transporter ATP-binding protein [Paramaledivibacter caminithermalis]|jgi:energy-coupling factor transport system ATP-binding protein|uniref:Energy-coupling factor transport system ATP-binding protein n=1 Tax=Paramaledivibacter caminithermalis (strain DSM 15212 / CIP 107654 / DViRD3) TaxID=1121301 RepID=A0A1M6R995_PARC5|nr:ATP-binding cassette domain-containing protein [Paramaledivibacter caminithermalis]SHK29034.1 energy-coupling factor transport system ATP-binding protein [Paramaledivibacter caminithermalis DSM 15212]